MAAATTILWGYHPVVEALRARRRRIYKLHLAQDKGVARQEAVELLARKADVAVQWMESRQLSALVGHRRHQGVAATVGAYPFSSLREILETGPAARTKPFVLVLDQIVDPQNLGAIIRTALCAGVQGVIMPKDRSAPLSPAASKASAGALEHMPVVVVTNLVSAIETLKGHGLWVAGADRHGRHGVFDTELHGPLALVIGGEEKGLRPLVSKKCDFTVAIPQIGPIGALNASAAAAIIIYEIFRQRRVANAQIAR